MNTRHNIYKLRRFAIADRLLKCKKVLAVKHTAVTTTFLLKVRLLLFFMFSTVKYINFNRKGGRNDRK